MSKKEVTMPEKIKGIRPFGSGILVELLNDQEALGTTIILDKKNAKMGAPQGIILALGDKLPENVGIKVGDRVMLQGNGFVPVPNYDDHPRERGIAEISHIKAIFS